MSASARNGRHLSADMADKDQLKRLGDHFAKTETPTDQRDKQSADKT